MNRFNDIEPDFEEKFFEHTCFVDDDEPLEFEEFRLAKIAERDANEPLGQPSGDERRQGKA